jgi:tripartite ATP-independent transporter DctM subunit
MPIDLLVTLVILLAVLFIGTPVSFGLGFVAIALILLYLSPGQLAQLGSIAYDQSTSINLMIAPLFIFMAEILSQSGIAGDIFMVMSRWLRKVKGGLAISATLAAAIFAALCGSSPATAATIGRISIKEMVERGYQEEFTTGIVAAGGTLGIMIPPSLAMVIFGILTETSIAKLFIAGILPGLVIVVLIIGYILIRGIVTPEVVGCGKAPCPAPAERERDAMLTTGLRQDLKLLVPPLLLIFILLYSLYTGIATPSEIAGFGSVGALLFSFTMGRLNLKTMESIFIRTARFGAMISFMIIGGLTLSYVVSFMGLPKMLTDWVIEVGVNRWAFMILVYALWLVLGCLIDPTSMIVLTIPFLFPVFNAFDFHPIWLGVVSTLAVEIGMITPPVGLNIFIIKAISDVPMQKIIAGVIPLVAILLLALLILSLFPEIALFLPTRM